MKRAYQKRTSSRSRGNGALKEAIQLMLDPVELIRQLQHSVHTIRRGGGAVDGKEAARGRGAADLRRAA
jgi:hypothetical protein